MARPSAISSAVVVHGGTTWVRLKWVNGQRPRVLAGGRELVHRGRRGAGGVERDERCVGLAVAHQFERPEHAEPAHLADRRVPLGQFGQRRADDVAPRIARVLDDPLFLEDVDRGDRGSRTPADGLNR